MIKLLIISIAAFALCMFVLHKILFTWYKNEAGTSWKRAQMYYWSGLLMISGFVATGAVLVFK